MSFWVAHVTVILFRDNTPTLFLVCMNTDLDFGYSGHKPGCFTAPTMSHLYIYGVTRQKRRQDCLVSPKTMRKFGYAQVISGIWIPAVCIISLLKYRLRHSLSYSGGHFMKASLCSGISETGHRISCNGLSTVLTYTRKVNLHDKGHLNEILHIYLEETHRRPRDIRENTSCSPKPNVILRLTQGLRGENQALALVPAAASKM